MRYMYLLLSLGLFVLLALFYWGYFIALLILSFMILFHEWGHFIAARACGVHVEVFSIGFGKKEWCLLVYQYGKTEYRIAPILLGGYVKMLGQDDLEPSKTVSSPESYTNKTPLQRIIILLAGPFANLLLGFIALVLVAWIGKKEIAPIIAAPESLSPAYHAHLQAGDEIVRVNGIPTRTWDELSTVIKKFDGHIELEILRNSRTFYQSVTPILKEIPNIFGEPIERPVIGIRPLSPMSIKVHEASPLQAIGLQNGDTLLALNGEKIATLRSIPHLIEQAQQPIRLTFLRFGQEQTVVLPASAHTLRFESLAQMERMVSYDFLDGIIKGWENTVELSSLMVVSIGKLFERVVPITEVGGVVMAVEVISTAANNSLVAVLFIGALISLNLGIVNLLPIPILDGGHIIFNLYEWIFKSPLSPKAMNRFAVMGAVVIAMLMLLGLYNDINRIMQ